MVRTVHGVSVEIGCTKCELVVGQRSMLVGCAPCRRRGADLFPSRV